MAHVVWDWNGTLFDDQAVTMAALHAVLDDAGVPRIDAEEYKRLYVRPVRLFYETLFGRAIDDREWQHLDDLWHASYAEAMDVAGLTVGATAALEAVSAAGHTQSLLSMYRHDHLLELVSRFGISHHFVRVEGLRGPGGGRKTPYLHQHLLALGGLARGDGEVLVVGDALDDATAAADCEVRCVLFDGGSHLREELEGAGVPVLDDLADVPGLLGTAPAAPAGGGSAQPPR